VFAADDEFDYDLDAPAPARGLVQSAKQREIERKQLERKRVSYPTTSGLPTSPVPNARTSEKQVVYAIDPCSLIGAVMPGGHGCLRGWGEREEGRTEYGWWLAASRCPGFHPLLTAIGP
jgi:hypothetical protein